MEKRIAMAGRNSIEFLKVLETTEAKFDYIYDMLQKKLEKDDKRGEYPLLAWKTVSNSYKKAELAPEYGANIIWLYYLDDFERHGKAIAVSGQEYCYILCKNDKGGVDEYHANKNVGGYIILPALGHLIVRPSLEILRSLNGCKEKTERLERENKELEETVKKLREELSEKEKEVKEMSINNNILTRLTTHYYKGIFPSSGRIKSYRQLKTAVSEMIETVRYEEDVLEESL